MPHETPHPGRGTEMEMTRYASQLAAAQRHIDNLCDCCDHGPREPAPYIEREPYADTYSEWAGVESRRRPFFPSNWQEGDPF